MMEINQHEFEKLTKYINENYGVNLGENKKYLIVTRLEKLLNKMEFNDWEQYYKYVISDNTGEAASNLINKITTNYTYFMRESEHFSFLMKKVLPGLKVKIKDNDIRIWSAGCSSGQEAYTLGMIMDEIFYDAKETWNRDVLATDISDDALRKARVGVYSNQEIANLPQKWQKKYFDKFEDNSFVIKESLKKNIIIRKFNLTEEQFPFRKNFHVIFCRNVMIYFDEISKNRLINKFYDSLEPGGYLFIGHSEMLKANNYFEYIQTGIYRKIQIS